MNCIELLPCLEEEEEGEDYDDNDDARILWTRAPHTQEKIKRDEADMDLRH